MLYGFMVNNYKACFVISFGTGVVTCISLFGDKPGYDHCCTPMQGLESIFGLQNKDPYDHEEIHQEMGRLMNMDPEDTKTGSTHFHWVCGLDKDQWPCVLLEMKKFGFIMQKQVQTIIKDIERDIGA